MNILIDGVYFHDYDLGPSCFKPSDGGTSTGNPDCHWRSMYLNGVHNLTLRLAFPGEFHRSLDDDLGAGGGCGWEQEHPDREQRVGTGVNYGTPASIRTVTGRWESFDFAWCQNAQSVCMATTTSPTASTRRPAGSACSCSLTSAARARCAT